MTVGNRVLWSIIGVLLLGAGVVGVLASRGQLSTIDSSQPLLTTRMVDSWNDSSALAAGLTIAAGLLVAILGALLLRAQLRGRGGAPMRDVTFGPSPLRDESGAVAVDPSRRPDAGRTEVASTALQHALQRDLEADRHVRRAAVRLTGSRPNPQLLVRLAVTPDADIARLAGHLDQAVRRFTTTSGVTPDLSDVVVRIASQPPQRVH